MMEEANVSERHGDAILVASIDNIIFQPFQDLRLLGPDAPQDRHRARQGLHAAASLPEWGLPLGTAPVVN